MKELSGEHQRKLKKNVPRLFEVLNTALKENGFSDFKLRGFHIGPAEGSLKCPKGYHKEVYIDPTGHVTEFCAKD